MSLEFKKLADVVEVEENSRDYNLLVEENGIVKKISADDNDLLEVRSAVESNGLGYMKDDEVHQIAKKFLPVEELIPEHVKSAMESAGFGYTDANDEVYQIDSKFIKKEDMVPSEVKSAIEDGGIGHNVKVFETITWDGDIEGRASVSGYFFKVSDIVPSKEDLLGATVTFNDESTAILSEEMFQNLGDVLVVTGAFIIGHEGDSLQGWTFSESGIYFCYDSEDPYIIKLESRRTTCQIDPQFVPKELPEAPTDNGIYTLVCTVTEGSVSYNWATVEESGNAEEG